MLLGGWAVVGAHVPDTSPLVVGAAGTAGGRAVIGVYDGLSDMSGDIEGGLDGTTDGCAIPGVLVGTHESCWVGDDAAGNALGGILGCRDGVAVGAAVGGCEGDTDGAIVGTAVP